MILGGGPMPVGRAIRRCEELREANRDDRVLEAVITRCLSALLAMAGRFDDARESARSSSRVLEEANMTGLPSSAPRASPPRRKSSPATVPARCTT